MLCLLFNSMLTHRYYPKELVKSTIMSIPKDKSIVYLRVPIIEVSRFLTVLISYLTMLLLIYVVIRYWLRRCNLVLNLSIPQHCVLLY